MSHGKSQFNEFKVYELCSQIIVAQKLGYLDSETEAKNMLEQCMVIINELDSLIHTLELKPKQRRKP